MELDVAGSEELAASLRASEDAAPRTQPAEEVPEEELDQDATESEGSEGEASIIELNSDDSKSKLDVGSHTTGRTSGAAVKAFSTTFSVALEAAIANGRKCPGCKRQFPNIKGRGIQFHMKSNACGLVGSSGGAASSVRGTSKRTNSKYSRPAAEIEPGSADESSEGSSEGTLVHKDGAANPTATDFIKVLDAAIANGRKCPGCKRQFPNIKGRGIKFHLESNVCGVMGSSIAGVFDNGGAGKPRNAKRTATVRGRGQGKSSKVRVKKSNGETEDEDDDETEDEVEGSDSDEAKAETLKARQRLNAAARKSSAAKKAENQNVPIKLITKAGRPRGRPKAKATRPRIEQASDSEEGGKSSASRGTEATESEGGESSGAEESGDSTSSDGSHAGGCGGGRGKGATNGVSRAWCDVCRGGADSGGDLVSCVSCPRKYHRECVQDSSTGGRDRDSAGGAAAPLRAGDLGWACPLCSTEKEQRRATKGLTKAERRAVKSAEEAEERLRASRVAAVRLLFRYGCLLLSFFLYLSRIWLAHPPPPRARAPRVLLIVAALVRCGPATGASAGPRGPFSPGSEPPSPPLSPRPSLPASSRTTPSPGAAGAAAAGEAARPRQLTTTAPRPCPSCGAGRPLSRPSCAPTR